MLVDPGASDPILVRSEGANELILADWHFKSLGDFFSISFHPLEFEKCQNCVLIWPPSLRTTLYTDFANAEDPVRSMEAYCIVSFPVT